MSVEKSWDRFKYQLLEKVQKHIRNTLENSVWHQLSSGKQYLKIQLLYQIHLSMVMLPNCHNNCLKTNICYYHLNQTTSIYHAEYGHLNAYPFRDIKS